MAPTRQSQVGRRCDEQAEQEEQCGEATLHNFSGTKVNLSPGFIGALAFHFLFRLAKNSVIPLAAAIMQPADRSNIGSAGGTNPLHLASVGAFLTSVGASLAASVVVLATLCGASLTAFHAQGAKHIRELGIAGAQTCAKRTDVCTVTTRSDTFLMALHGQTHGATLFALHQTS